MPSLPDNEPPSNPQLAALVAINIVTQVLDEAEDILNIANDSGKTWRHVWRQKKGRGRCYNNDEILGILDFKVHGSDENSSEIIESGNVIVTSTPQKEIGNITRTCNESGYIGQGDEDIQTRNTDLRSPSMLINCLFDMSDVDQVGTIEIFDDVYIGSESRNFVTNSIAKLVETYVNAALNTVCGDAIISEHEVVARFEGSRDSSYSMLTDALISDYTENDNTVSYIDVAKSEVIPISVKMAYEYNEDVKEITKNDIDSYEKTFLTLNRDYEIYSDEEDFLADAKSLTMQEVELPANTFSDDITQHPETIEVIVTKDEGPISSSKVIESQKRSLVKRCRLQGAKFISRLRKWWWRQNVIGKRKACRSGICPLSPEVRNRTGSLLDHRKLRSPSPSRMAAWKFNTVNEGLINSYNMKDFELEISNVPVEKD